MKTYELWLTTIDRAYALLDYARRNALAAEVWQVGDPPAWLFTAECLPSDWFELIHYYQTELVQRS